MRKSTLFFGVALIGAALASCSDSKGEPGNGPDKKPELGQLTRQNVELNASMKEIALGQYRYPVDLLKTVYEKSEDKNPMVSPLGASVVLGMIANALEPADQTEILKTLGVSPKELEAYNEYSRKLNEVLPTIDPSATFTLDNAFWLKSDGEMSQDYRTALTGHYYSELGSFEDFDTSVVDEINGWISGRTGGAIKDLLSYEDAESDINTVWVNALYFKGFWRQAFDKANTETRDFYPSYPGKGDPRKVRMMYGNDFRYIDYTYPTGSGDRSDAITTVMLPFGNESYIFTAVLPAANNPDIASTLGALTPEYWQRLDGEISSERDEPGDVTVRLPQLNLENTLDLIPVFEGMGVKKIFDHVSMTKHLGYEREQMIKVFRQKNVFDVDEEGSEIKSATVAEGMDGAAGPGFTKSAVFDRPFIYFVRERSTGAVLLAGVYTCPE